MADAWVTAEEVFAAKARFVEAMPGWQSPLVHALGVSGDDGTIDWRVTNYPDLHDLPAVVLGTVLGYRSGSATYWLNIQQLDQAITLLRPAGACAAFDHPNLWAWQQLRAEFDDEHFAGRPRVVVVFISSDAPVDEPQRQLREMIGLDGPDGSVP